jgi:succinate dehydrogenase / fumarate reductase cytochrome b subunit
MWQGLQEYFRYKWDAGFVAFLLHRVTGIGLLVYLGMHIWSIFSLHDPALFNQTMWLYAHPIFKLGEIALFFTILVHALNGIRIILVDFTDAARYHKTLLWVLTTVGSITFLWGAYELFPWKYFIG